MKNILLIIVLAALVGCGTSEKNNEKASPQDSTEAAVAGNYGDMVSTAELVSLENFQTTLDQDSSFTGKIKVKIDDVCQMKGCWMTAKLPDGRSVRITFKDYGFFVPKNSMGFTAVIEGEALKKVIDEETRKHYAEESGKAQDEIDAISGPGEELSFVASGVVIQGE